MTSADDAERIVREFCDSFDGRDAESLRPYFTDDVVYHNIPLDPAVGIDATIAFIDAFFGMCDTMTIETVHLAVHDNLVLTERIDTFTDRGYRRPVAGHGDLRGPGREDQRLARLLRPGPDHRHAVRRGVAARFSHVRSGR